MEAKKTIGQIIREHDIKGPGIEDHVREYSKGMALDAIEAARKAADDVKDLDTYKGKDFYVVLSMFPDPVLQQPRIMPFTRKSPPTPAYNQDVYKYLHRTGDLYYLWSLPDKHRCYDIMRNPSQYLNDKSWYKIARMVQHAFSGKLLEIVKQENGELKDAIIYLKPQGEMNA